MQNLFAKKKKRLQNYPNDIIYITTSIFSFKEIVKNLWENYANYQMNDFFTNKLSIGVVLEEGLRNSTIFKLMMEKLRKIGDISVFTDLS